MDEKKVDEKRLEEKKLEQVTGGLSGEAIDKMYEALQNNPSLKGDRHHKEK